MSAYTVFEPPQRVTDTGADPERFVFVRDGFSFWAFVLAPVWLLVKRLWLVFVLYLVAMGVLHAGLWSFGASAGTGFLVDLLVALLMGLEATALRRWTLVRRGWRDLGTVVGPDLETAEHRFYDRWARQQVRPKLSPTTEPPPGPAAPYAPPHAPPTVLGLFPEPGVQR